MKLIKRMSLLPLILLFVIQVSAATFVASKNSDAYHISSCGQAGKIKSENLITFGSADAAEASGRHPCSFCRDEISQARKSGTQSGTSTTVPPTTVPATSATNATTPLTTKATTPSTTKPTSPSAAPSTSSTSPGYTPLTYTSSTRSSSSGNPFAALFILAVLFFFFHVYIHYSHKRTIQELQSRINELEHAYQYQLEVNRKSSKAENQYRQPLEESQKQLSNTQSVYESYSPQTNSALTERINELTVSLEESERKRKEFLDSMRQAYGNDFLLQASGAPKGTYWDEYGYPRCSVSTCSDPYILHRSSTGRFHAPGCSHSRNCITVHALDVPREEFMLNRCQICKPEYPDLSWKEKYRHLYKLTK